MGTSLAKRLVVYAVVILLIACIAGGITWVMTDAGTPDYQIPESAKQVSNDRYDVALKVVDENDEPIRVARIKINWFHDPSARSKYAQVFTNDDGMAYIDMFGDEFYYASLELRARGYQTLYRTWGNRRTVDKKVDFPKELTVQMPRGETIGGVIVSQLGEPIIGAKVELFSDSEWHDDGEYYARLQETTPTDGNGRWELTNAPPEMNDLRIRVSHSSHLEERSRRQSYQTVSNSDIEKMKSKSHRLEMERGLIVEGRVTNEDGEGVSGAMIILGKNPDERPNRNYLPRTDYAGNFKYKLGEEGSDTLTVLSPDYMPQEVPVNVSPNMGPVNVALTKGTPFEVVVNGEDGKPLNDVQVIPVQWGDNECLQLLFREETQLKTDAQGKVVWENAPQETVNFWFRKDGLMFNSASLEPREDAHMVSMMKTKKVIVTAVDAETGDKIPNFVIEEGYRSSVRNGVNYYNYGFRGRRGVEESYEHDINSVNEETRFKVSAPGHKPAETPEIKASEIEGNRWEIVVKLEQGKGPEGRILTADGKPVSGADVMLFTNNGQAQINDNSIPSWGRSIVVQTDDKGEFKFDPQDDEVGLAAISEEGFLKLEPGTVPEKGDHQLKPFGKVTGRLLDGTEPGVEKRINLHSTALYQDPTNPRAAYNLRIYYNVETDSNGIFELEKIIPGTYEIRDHKEVPYGERGTMLLSSGLGRYTFEAGDNEEITVGGVGRPAKGKIVIPENITPTHVRLYARRQPEITEPTAVASPDLGNALIKGFLNNLADAAGVPADGEQEEADSPKVETPYLPMFETEMQDDGTFQFDEIPPGNYQLQGQAYNRVGNNEYGEQVGQISSTFEIPEPAEGEPKFNSEVLDLGDVDLAPIDVNRGFRSSF